VTMSSYRTRALGRPRSVPGTRSSGLSTACGRSEDDVAVAVDNRWTPPVDRLGTRWGQNVHAAGRCCGNDSCLWATVHSTPVAPQPTHTPDHPSDQQERRVLPDSHRRYYYDFPKFYLFS
jgi:hypothetical protein